MSVLKKYAMLAAVLALTTGCASSTTQGTETEKALCEVWGASLPTRSRHDTVQTRKEVGEIYAAFAAVCPKHADLIP